MAVQRWALDRRTPRQASANAPLASVIVGAEAGLRMGVVETRVPAGAVMPEHGHGNSEVVLIILAGHGRIISGPDDTVTELDRDGVVTIPAGQHVRVENPGTEEVRMLVVLTPPDFTNAVGGWSEARDGR